MGGRMSKNKGRLNGRIQFLRGEDDDKKRREIHKRETRLSRK